MSRKQELAVAALLQQPTIKAAAAKAGVEEKTLRRWLQCPEFLAAFRAARRRVVEAAIGTLQSATGSAVKTLRKLLGSKADGVRLGAARCILEHALKGLEVADSLQRIEALEQRLLEANQRKGY